MRLFEVQDGELCVVLQGGKGLVAKQLLDVGNVSPDTYALGRTAPPEGVRRDVLVDLRMFSSGMDHVQKDLVLQPTASMDKERTLCRVGNKIQAHSHDVAFKIFQRCFANRYNPIFLALASNSGRCQFQVNILDIELEDLPHPDPGRVKHL